MRRGGDFERTDRPPPPAVYADIAEYYGGKVLRHGPTPLGVDWTCVPTQELRFVQLLKIVGRRRSFSINDVGCGYGALLDFLRKRFASRVSNYAGVDLAPEMITHAKQRNEDMSDVQFEVGHEPAAPADYSMASGIFNVKLYRTDRDWHNYIVTTLRAMAGASRRGFAVNFLSPLGVGEVSRQELYRVHPEVWLDYCREQLGWEAYATTAYGLREFTLCAVNPSPRRAPAKPALADTPAPR